MAGQKRKDARDGGNSKSKKAMYYKTASSTIHPGTSGIFATCNRHKERQCTQELIELFNDEAEKQYNTTEGEASDDDADEDNDDIEASLAKELDSFKAKKADKVKLFTPLDLGCECVIFFRTKKPVDPVSFVHKICSEALTSGTKSTRYTLRLSPVSLTASANEDELKKLALKVLEPHFHAKDQKPLKFAIRPTSRNHTTLDRDQIIKIVASAVGNQHKVDLTNYDKLILVEAFKNIIGISVVDGDFEKLKRYNLQQIFESKSLESENSKDEPTEKENDDTTTT
ncbi:hypothetical protein BZA70DRAFT_284238 [Myxozyma melibiosi]|uniref:THUMP domain-containing protein n=1 Tax=Myxozyma melibiosi TaxID=54550 RepID=A0ABR1EZ76_9ASCO